MINTLHRSLAQEVTIQDYALLTPVQQVPAGIKKYICYERRQTKGNSHFTRLKKRHKLKGSWNDALAKAVELKYTTQIQLPHVKLRSVSTGQNFLLFIHQKVTSKPVEGTFNGYGLALSGETVPSF